MKLRLILLGSGQDGGRPQMGSPSSGQRRTASSVALVSDLWRPVLFDASPDIRNQYLTLLDNGGLDGQGSIGAVFITHAHMGHYAGLVHFGKEAANTSGVPLYADVTVLDFLGSNEPWASLFGNGNLRPLAIPSEGIILGRVTIEAISVPHRADFTATSAFSIVVDGAPWALYIPDIDAWDAWPECTEVIAAHDLCLVDATFGSDTELPERSISELPHPLVTDTLDRFADLAVGKTLVLTHINHSNPLNDPGSDLTALALGRGFIIGEDGMVFTYGSRT